MTGRKRVRTFGHVRKRNSGRWQAVYVVNGRFVSGGVFGTKVEADNALARVRADMTRGQWTDPALGRIRLRTYATSWLDNRAGITPRTHDVYRSLLNRHVLPAFGDWPMNSISPEAVRHWFAGLSKRHTSTARAAYRLLRAIFNTAIEDGRLTVSPCRVKGASSDKAGERRVPTAEEVEKLIIALPDTLRAAGVLAAGAGLRRGEVLGLKRSDIDLGGAVVHVRRQLLEPSDGRLRYGPTKNKERRSVHVSPEVVEELRSHLDRHAGGEIDAPLFTGKTGELRRPSSLEYQWRKARRSCGLTHVHFHDLRHFHATTYSAHGASLREVMARGGWKSPSMVARYQHATPERDAELANRLPRLLRGTPALNGEPDEDAGDDSSAIAR